MQIKIFTLPLTPTEEQTEELNRFLRGHRVIDLKRELATIDGNMVWTFCILFSNYGSDTGKLQVQISAII